MRPIVVMVSSTNHNKSTRIRAIRVIRGCSYVRDETKSDRRVEIVGWAARTERALEAHGRERPRVAADGVLHLHSAARHRRAAEAAARDRVLAPLGDAAGHVLDAERRYVCVLVRGRRGARGYSP